MPTIGDTGTGTLSISTTSNKKHAFWGSLCVLPVTGRFISMSARCGAWDAPARMGMYKIVDGIDVAELKAVTQEITIPVPLDWYTANFSPQPILPPANYAVCVHFGLGSPYDSITLRVTTTTGNDQQVDVPDTYIDGLSDPFGSGGSYGPNSTVCVYATYEEVKGGDEGLGARAVLPILSLPFSKRFPRLMPLKV